MTDYAGILRVLTHGGVEFILIGGMAANFHGAIRSTSDVDVLYRRDKANMARLAAALEPIHPTLRGAPAGLPFRFDARTIERGLNFTLSTDLGPVDLLGEVAGGGSYDALLDHSVVGSVLGVSCRCVDLDTLIRLKRAAGRPKDFEAVAELEALREERDSMP